MSGVLALVLAFLAVCPCGPMTTTGSDGEGAGHACCAPKTGISERTADCCADDGQPPEVAVSSAPPPSAAGPAPVAFLVAAVSLTPSPMPASPPNAAARRILRI